MSVSPLQKRVNPPPVPEMPTVTRVFGFFFWNASAAAVTYGPSVLEPSAVMVPLEALPLAPTVPAATAAPAATVASNPAVRLNRMSDASLS